MTLRVLVVDDDERLYELIASYLEQNDVSPVSAENGRRALDLLEREAFDAVLLDVMMPGMDGLAVLKALRARWPSQPVIMLTAKGDETDRVVGLELGADDYLGKPFSPRELLARLRAVLRRTEAPTGERPESNGARIRHGAITVDLERHEARYDGELVVLTPTELGLLAALLERPGIVLSRAQLMKRAYAYDNLVTERTIDTHVRRVRAKFREHGADPIATVHGVGYKASEA